MDFSKKNLIAGIIPARYSSTRFPGKPLVDIMGTSMVMRVYKQAEKASQLKKIVVATDDKRIFDHVNNHGGYAVFTRPDHLSGTERCAEVADMQEFKEFSHFINIQGDEPFIEPGQIDLLSTCFEEEETSLATLVRKFTSAKDMDNRNTVKVVLNNHNNALYFSRSVIPFLRDVPKEDWLSRHNFYQHIGIYGYHRDALAQIALMKSGYLENAESLEQLRWLENGMSIKVKISEHDNFSVDTPEDLEKLIAKKGK